jgi:hypothetical protein
VTARSWRFWRWPSLAVLLSYDAAVVSLPWILGRDVSWDLRIWLLAAPSLAMGWASAFRYGRVRQMTLVTLCFAAISLGSVVGHWLSAVWSVAFFTFYLHPGLRAKWLPDLVRRTAPSLVVPGTGRTEP